MTIAHLVIKSFYHREIASFRHSTTQAQELEVRENQKLGVPVLRQFCGGKKEVKQLFIFANSVFKECNDLSWDVTLVPKLDA